MYSVGQPKKLTADLVRLLLREDRNFQTIQTWNPPSVSANY